MNSRSPSTFVPFSPPAPKYDCSSATSSCDPNQQVLRSCTLVGTMSRMEDPSEVHSAGRSVEERGRAGESEAATRELYQLVKKERSKQQKRRSLTCSASFLEEKGHGRALIHKPELPRREKDITRISKDSAVEDRPVHVPHHGTNISKGISAGGEGRVEGVAR